jgi:excisionase family DNA binding protein
MSELTRAIENSMTPLLVDVREAARLLSCSDRTLWSLTAPRGPIPCLRLGRAVRYAIADLEAFIRDSRESQTQPPSHPE